VTKVALHFFEGDLKQVTAVLMECRESKTKVITLAHNKENRQSSEPMSTRNKYIQLTLSSGKCVRGI